MNRARRESGITLIEIIVVLVLIAIMMGVAIFSIRSSRNAGSALAAIAAAQAYADAADSFARDHDGRYPGAHGSTDWPGGAAAARGPFDDALGERRFYLKQVPEAVQDQRIGVGAPVRTGQPYFAYAQTGGGTGYRITLHVPGRPTCVINGGATPDTGARCSRR